MSRDMSGKVCLVTGATDGHGKAVARALAEQILSFMVGVGKRYGRSNPKLPTKMMERRQKFFLQTFRRVRRSIRLLRPMFRRGVHYICSSIMQASLD